MLSYTHDTVIGYAFTIDFAKVDKDDTDHVKWLQVLINDKKASTATRSKWQVPNRVMVIDHTGIRPSLISLMLTPTPEPVTINEIYYEPTTKKRQRESFQSIEYTEAT